jgi:predicted ThiF/HesA family dinucleotide-utilizing enzyme
MSENERAPSQNHFLTGLHRKLTDSIVAVQQAGGNASALTTEVLRQINQTRQEGANPATGKGVTKSGQED